MLPWSCRISPCDGFNRLIFTALCIKTQNNLHLNSICQGVNFGVNNMILTDFFIVGQYIKACYSINYFMQLFYEVSFYPLFMWHLACTSIKLITIKIHTDAHCLFPVLSLTISALFLAVVNPLIALADWGQTSSSWLRRLSLPRPWEAVSGGAELQFQGVLLAISYRPTPSILLLLLRSHPGCSHLASVGSF